MTRPVTDREGLAEAHACPKCDHPLDDHGRSGCMDTMNDAAERDNLGFCVCQLMPTQILADAFAKVDADDPTTITRLDASDPDRPRGDVRGLGDARREAVRDLLAAHRVNYHHRAITPNGEPLTTANMRYTSCEGCDWLGGHKDEAGWEDHLAAALAPLVAGWLGEERERIAVEIETTATDPDRRRPTAADAETATDFANDFEWAAQIARAAA